MAAVNVPDGLFAWPSTCYLVFITFIGTYHNTGQKTEKPIRKLKQTKSKHRTNKKVGIVKENNELQPILDVVAGQAQPCVELHPLL